MTKHEQSVATHLQHLQHPLRSPPMLPIGPTHCHLHHCTYCVRYHKMRLSTMWKCSVQNGQQFRQAWTHMVHRPATQQPLPHWPHILIGPSSASTETEGSAPPHTLSSSANGQEHITLLTVPGTVTFTLHLVNTLRGTWHKRTQVLSQSIMFQIKTLTHNVTKQPNIIVHACPVQAHPLQSLHCGRHYWVRKTGPCGLM